MKVSLVRSALGAVALFAGLTAAPPLALAVNNDLCVTFDDSCCNERLVAKDFFPLPAKNKCKAINGFMLPFFSVSSGTVCTSANGQTLFVQWAAVNNSSSGASMWSANIPLPLPNDGIGQIVGTHPGQAVSGQSSVAMSAAKCEEPVPNNP